MDLQQTAPAKCLDLQQAKTEILSLNGEEVFRSQWFFFAFDWIYIVDLMSSESCSIVLDHLSWCTLDALYNIKMTEKRFGIQSQHIAAIFVFTRLSAKTNSTKVTQ